jgi:hypothetical protein
MRKYGCNRFVVATPTGSFVRFNSYESFGGPKLQAMLVTDIDLATPVSSALFKFEKLALESLEEWALVPVTVETTVHIELRGYGKADVK